MSCEEAVRWRLRHALELVLTVDGDAYLLRGGRGADHVIRQPSSADRRVLEALASDGLAVTPDTDDAWRIAPLVSAGVVVSAQDDAGLDPADAERFDRQLPYLEELGPPVALQRRLRDSSVAVIGCGGLGTWVIAGLACAGIGRFTLVDDDVVSLSNLNRQVLYSVDDIGCRKVHRAAAWLAEFDERITVDAQVRRIEGPQDLDRLAAHDVWVLAADWPPYDLARWVNQASLREGVPFIVAGQQPPLVRVGPTFVPGAGACHDCHEAWLRARTPMYDDLATARRARPPQATTLGPLSALAGGIVASEVLHLLTGSGDVATAGRVVVVNARTLESRSDEVRPFPGCPSCGA